jgi:hypothetical protein
MFGVEGDIELLFDDQTYKTLHDNGTKKAIRIEIEDTNTELST